MSIPEFLPFPWERRQCPQDGSPRHAQPLGGSSQLLEETLEVAPSLQSSTEEAASRELGKEMKNSWHSHKNRDAARNCGVQDQIRTSIFWREQPCPELSDQITMITMAFPALLFQTS